MLAFWGVLGWVYCLDLDGSLLHVICNLFLLGGLFLGFLRNSKIHSVPIKKVMINVDRLTADYVTNSEIIKFTPPATLFLRLTYFYYLNSSANHHTKS